IIAHAHHSLNWVFDQEIGHRVDADSDVVFGDAVLRLNGNCLNANVYFLRAFKARDDNIQARPTWTARHSPELEDYRAFVFLRDAEDSKNDPETDQTCKGKNKRGRTPQ